MLVQAHASGDAVHDDADVCVLFVRSWMSRLGFRFLGALRPRALGQRRGHRRRPGQRAVQFLPPVGHIARRTVDSRSCAAASPMLVNWWKTSVGMYTAWPVVRRMRSSPRHISPVAFDDEVDLFLLLVVPRHLAAVRLQRDMAHGEVGGLDGAHAATRFCVRRRAGYVRPAICMKIGNDHCGFAPELQIGFVLDDALQIHAEFQRVIVAPHARFAGGHFLARRHVSQPFGPVIDRVQDQALVRRIGAQVRLGKQRVGDRETRLPVPVVLQMSVRAAAGPAPRSRPPNCPPARDRCTDRRAAPPIAKFASPGAPVSQ